MTVSPPRTRTREPDQVCAEAVETAKLKEREKDRPNAFDSKQGVLVILKRESK